MVEALVLGTSKCQFESDRDYMIYRVKEYVDGKRITRGISNSLMTASMFANCESRNGNRWQVYDEVGFTENIYVNGISVYESDEYRRSHKRDHPECHEYIRMVKREHICNKKISSNDDL